MKQHFKLFALLLIAACTNEAPPEIDNPAPIDEAKEQQAIMAVIENETQQFFAGNYERWADNWSHQPYAFQAWNNSDGTADAAIGWEKINAQGKNWIETYYKNGENVIHPHVVRTKPIVKFFSENMAYLIWVQYNADKEKQYYRPSTETRIMEKEASGWKIVNVSALWDTGPKVHADSLPAL
jgi:hypothetical protein